MLFYLKNNEFGVRYKIWRWLSLRGKAASLVSNTAKSSISWRHHLNEGLDYYLCHLPDCPDFLKPIPAKSLTVEHMGKTVTRPFSTPRLAESGLRQLGTLLMFGAHLPLKQVHKIIHHATEGVSVRATARLLGLTKNTVNLAIVKVGEYCQKAYSSLIRDSSWARSNWISCGPL
jgi:hypothetical protein